MADHWSVVREVDVGGQITNWKPGIVGVVNAPTLTMVAGERIGIDVAPTGAFTGHALSIANYVDGDQSLSSSYTFESAETNGVYLITGGQYLGYATRFTGTIWGDFPPAQGGGSSFRKITGDATINTSDRIVVCEPGGTSMTVTLPNAATGDHGQELTFIRIGSGVGNVVINTVSSEPIYPNDQVPPPSTVTSHTMSTAYRYFKIVSMGSDGWFTLTTGAQG